MFHKRLLKEFQDNTKLVFGMVALQWISLLANVLFVYQTAKLIEGMYHKEIGVLEIKTYLMVLLGVVITRIIMTVVGGKLSFLASTTVKKRLRTIVYEKVLRLGSSYHEKVSTSEVVQISTEGVEQLEIYFGKYVPQFFYSLLAPITLFAIVGTMDLRVSFVLLACVPLIPVSIIGVQKFAKKLLNKYWGTYTGLGDTFLESLQGLVTLKIYNADEKYAQKMDEDAEKFRKITMRVLIMQLNSISIMDLIAYGGAAIGIILALLDYKSGGITLTQCFFIIMVSAEFFLPLRLLGSFFHIAMNGNAAANKIFRLIDMEEPKEGSVKELKSGDININHLTFAYEDSNKNTLKDISLSIHKNQLVAIVGESGCGKSTLASLIMNENEDKSQSITIGDVKLSMLDKETIRKHITKINHNSYLFKGTVESNLLMGNEKATKEEMLEALKKVQLYDFIMEHGGLAMELTEKASNLSGGQCQRLALARALLHDSDIYIFDEATSNIDVESENNIMERIHELSKNKTVILISHRLANVVDADKIYVMEHGHIVEEGKHKELVNKNGVYKNLYEKQRNLEKYRGFEGVGGEGNE